MKHFLPFFFFPLLSSLLPAQTIQVTVLNGSEVRCCTDSIVTIQITPNPNGIIQEIKLDWGDGSGIVSIFPGQPLVLSHQYSTYQFCSECRNYSCDVSAAITGFCYQISVFANYTNLQPENVSKILTYKIPPRVTATANPSVPCVGTPVTFAPNICPANDNSFQYKWTFPDNSMSTLVSPVFTFDHADTFFVTLVAIESVPVCRNDTTVYPIVVLDSAIAGINVLSGALVNDTLCIGLPGSGGGTLVLDGGTPSKNETTYSWNQSGGAIFETPLDTTVVRVRIFQSGTYTFTLTVNNGCDAPDEVTFTVYAVNDEALTLNHQPTVCNKLSYTPSPKNPNATYTVDGAVVQDFPVMLGIGQHTVSAQLKNICGNQVRTDVFMVDTPTPVHITAPVDPDTVCQGAAPVSLLADQPNVEWAGPVIIDTSGQAFFNPADSGIFTITAYYQRNTTCETSDEVRIVVQGVPVITLQPQTDECAPFDYEPIVGPANATVLVNGQPIGGGHILLDTTGTYFVTATLDAGACDVEPARDTFVLKAKQNVLITSPLNGDTLCSGNGPVTLIANPNDVNWYGEGITGGIFHPQQEGDVTIRAVYAEDSSCETEDMIAVYVNVVTAAASDLAVCPGLTSVLLSGMPGNGVWTSPACTGCIQNDRFFFAAYPGPYPVSLTYTVTDGTCSSDTTIQLDIIMALAAATLKTPLCTGSPIEVNINNSAADSNTWLIDGSGAGQPPFDSLPEGDHVLVQIAHLGACSDTLTLPFTVTAPPPPAIFSASATEGCPPLSVVFTPGSAIRPDVQYLWNFSGADPDSAGAWAPADSIVFANDSTSVKIYRVRYALTNVCGTNADSLDIVVNPNPRAELGLDSIDTGCSPHTVVITNRAAGNPDSCLLVISDGFSLDTCFSAFTRTFYADKQIETYLLYQKVINECGVSEWTDTVTVIPPGIEAFFEIDKALVCTNIPVQFHDASTPVPVSLQWTFGDEGVSNDPNPVFSFSKPNTTYNIVLRVTAGCGFDTIQHSITTLDEPSVAFEAPPFGCEDLDVFFENKSLKDLFAYYWEYSDGAVDSTRYHGVHRFAGGDAVYTARLTVVDWNGCTNSLEKDIPVRPKPVVGFYADPAEGCPGLEVQFTDTSRNVNRWHWVFADGAESFEQNPDKKFDQGEHTVKLIASWDGVCTDSATLPAFVRVAPCEVYVPNIFEPSSNGENAVFRVFGSSNLERVLVFRVYNRWGNMVFARDDFDQSDSSGWWDGAYKGEPLNPAVFVYYVEALFKGGLRIKLDGDVTLVR